MSKESFESLNEFKIESNNYLVPEALFEKDDDDGAMGKIMDRGLSFIPRAMRFKKAKKIMRKSLTAFTKKAKNLVNKFAAGFKAKVDVIDKEYKKLLKDKIAPLMKDGKEREAVDIIENQRKELEDYKKEQVNVLDKGIESILDSYTNSINQRIDNPGFVLNVELSEKGKGELKAKWAELSAIQKIEIEKEKTKLISSPGWRRLEEILAEMAAFVKKRKGSDAEIDVFIQDIIPNLDDNTYEVATHVRVSHGRPTLKEKGLLVGTDTNKLEYGAGVRTIKVTGRYQYNTRPYSLVVSALPDEFVRPYLIFKDMPNPVYGDIASFKVRAKSKEEKKQGDDRIVGKGEGDLEGEKPIIPAENKD